MVKLGDTCSDQSIMRSTPVKRVLINGQAAVTEGAASSSLAVVRGGSKRVIIEGRRAAMLGSKTTKGVITSSSSNVYCNGLR